MALDCGFLAAIAAIVVTEIVAGRNWSNLKVVVPVLLYLVANLTFHLEAMALGQADIGRRLGFGVVSVLILLIGGRIIPSFTRNWLVKRAAATGTPPLSLPARFGPVDRASLGVAVLALGLWVALPMAAVTAAGLMLAGAVQLIRLRRRLGWRTLASPLLLMLHLAFGFLPLGLIALGLAGFGLVPAATGLHLLGIGGFGGMTLAVMMRAALGHTGRVTEVGPVLAAAFGCIALAALVRAATPPGAGLWLAALLWSAGFATFALSFAPILAGASAGRKPANAKER